MTPQDYSFVYDMVWKQKFKIQLFLRIDSRWRKFKNSGFLKPFIAINSQHTGLLFSTYHVNILECFEPISTDVLQETKNLLISPFLVRIIVIIEPVAVVFGHLGANKCPDER